MSTDQFQTRESLCVAVLIDFLGVKPGTMEEASLFFQRRRALLKRMEGWVAPTEKMAHDISLAQESIIEQRFQDNMLMIWSSPTPVPLIYPLFLYLSALMGYAFEDGLLVRGAIAAGTVFMDEEEKVYIGPCISDLSAWYEVADWMGFVCCPNISALLEASLEFFPDGSRIPYYVAYDVPLRERDRHRLGSTVPAWVPAWPIFYTNGNDQAMSPFEYFINHLAAIPRAGEHEGKYRNTRAFFEHVMTLPVWEETRAKLGATHPAG